MDKRLTIPLTAHCPRTRSDSVYYFHWKWGREYGMYWTSSCLCDMRTSHGMIYGICYRRKTALRSKQQGKPQDRWAGLKCWRLPAGVSALFLLLIVASFAALAVACDDASSTPLPTATTAPEPVATTPPDPTAAPTPESTQEPVMSTAPETMSKPVALNDDDLTLAYVTSAIGYYGENGLEATLEFYKSEAGIQNGRTLILLDKAEGKLLVYRNVPALEGQFVGPGSSFPAFGQLLEVATGEGYWTMTRGINPVTKREEPRRVLVVLHDGLVFSASHSVLVEDVADSVKEYVDRAIAKYENDGLDAVITHYNGQDSLDGQFYLSSSARMTITLPIPFFLISSAPTSRTWWAPTGRNWARR